MGQYSVFANCSGETIMFFSGAGNTETTVYNESTNYLFASYIIIRRSNNVYNQSYKMMLTQKQGNVDRIFFNHKIHCENITNKIKLSCSLPAAAVIAYS